MNDSRAEAACLSLRAATGNRTSDVKGQGGEFTGSTGLSDSFRQTAITATPIQVKIRDCLRVASVRTSAESAGTEASRQMHKQ
jgi:hypothetical protein